jgi:CBS-domain-containing membrane protein
MPLVCFLNLLNPRQVKELKMNAQEMMTPDPITLDMKSRVRDAVQILQTLEIRHLPVVSETHTLIGMVSDRDLRNARIPYTMSDLRGAGGGELDRPIADIMSSDVLAIGPETEVAEIIDLMLDNKIGALPVVEDATGDLLGIVSYVDVLRHLRREID